MWLDAAISSVAVYYHELWDPRSVAFLFLTGYNLQQSLQVLRCGLQLTGDTCCHPDGML